MRTIEEAHTERDAKGFAAATDEALLLRYCKRGDRRAFDELVHRYRRELFNYLRRYLGDSEAAEDAFQQTFLQIHLHCDRFDGERRFRPWMYTIATNQAIDARRRDRRHKHLSLDRMGTGDRAGNDDVAALIGLLASSEPGPAADLQAEERARWIRENVRELPDTLRSSVLLVYYQGLKYREAAEILGVPVGTVKSRLHAAILKLNQAWTQTHPTESG
jgi:RNA polymerase sigma-70 factor (ECF subfamily)